MKELFILVCGSFSSMDYKFMHIYTKKRLRGRFFFSKRNVVALHVRKTLNAAGTKRNIVAQNGACTYKRPQDTKRNVVALHAKH